MLLKTVTLVMPVTSAPVRKLYDLETGKRVTTLNGLHDGQILVASSRDALKMVEYQILGPCNMGGMGLINGDASNGTSPTSATSTGAENVSDTGGHSSEPHIPCDMTVAWQYAC